MSEIIASTYEVIKEIGAGGGGIVYLAKHLRLDKKVVLKADRRKITAKPELLRREVDILKNLTHSYIPKVYDFFAENETVYTVMDFIEGESLDKVLKRGEKIPQAQVIEWGKQLLEALDYLHSPIHGSPPRGFVHSDIKPANLMLTPYGKICLIDFNIALALGEENVIGCSAGYASPEHYGLDYSGQSDHSGETTVLLSEEEMSESVSASSSSKKKIVPDVRSDIYSTGATLYHLFSGRRPARDANMVTPLTADEVSPLISAIIAKAMNPNPDLRYSTAAEMLYDFEHLHENDPRSRKLRRNIRTCAAVLSVTCAAGIFGAFVGLKRIQTTENRLKLAEYAENAIAEGDMNSAISLSLEAFSEKPGLFAPEYPAEIQSALASALAVYDLSDSFRSDMTVELPSAPLYMEISPNGTSCACIYSGNTAVIDLENGEITAVLPTDKSALSEVHFINENTIVYSGENGITAYDTKNNTTLWSGKPALAISVSADSKRVAALYKNESTAYIYSSSDGALVAEIDLGGRVMKTVTNDIFANPNAMIFSLNNSGDILAVSFSDGSLSVFDIDNPSDSFDIFSANSDYTRFEGGFSGDYLAFSAIRSDGSDFAVVDCKKKVQTGGFSSTDIYSVTTDSEQIIVQTDNILVQLDPKSGEQRALVNTAENITAYNSDGFFTLISANNKFIFFDQNALEISEFEDKFSADFLAVSGKTAVVGSRDSNVLRILKYKENSETEIISYNRDYIHDEARISADGKTVMLFSYRGFRIYDMGGEVVAEVEIPNADEVYDQQFRRVDGESYLEVFYNDGRISSYSAADGFLLDERAAEEERATLDEVFYTSCYRIEAPVHGAPIVYEIASGKAVMELENNAYLTYVTEIGDYIIAQYTTADSDFYGVLMNQKCEKLAELPRLCDVEGETLVFDYPTGKLRKTRIYKLSELLSTQNQQ